MESAKAPHRAMRECPEAPARSRVGRLVTEYRLLITDSEGADAETERLNHVVAGLGKREGVVDPQRAEGRIPYQSRAHRRADESRIGDLHRLAELGKISRSA